MLKREVDWVYRNYNTCINIFVVELTSQKANKTLCIIRSSTETKWKNKRPIAVTKTGNSVEKTRAFRPDKNCAATHGPPGYIFGDIRSKITSKCTFLCARENTESRKNTLSKLAKARLGDITLCCNLCQKTDELLSVLITKQYFEK